VQAVAGTLWWVAVFASDSVRRWTLGGWNPTLLVVPDLVLFAGASAVAAAFASRWWAAACATWTTMVTGALVAYALLEREAGWGAVAMVLATVGTLAATLMLWFGRLPVEWFFVGPFAFHVSEAHAPSAHLRRSLTQLVLFWSTFLIALPLVLSWAEQRLRLRWALLDGSGWVRLGVVVFVAFSALGLWACWSMAIHGEGTPLPAATARKLVVVGPYRRVRNPMAVAGAMQTIGVGLLLGSWMVIASSVAGALIWNTFVRPDEERDLANRLGPDYEEYRSDVRCWIPARR